MMLLKRWTEKDKRDQMSKEREPAGGEEETEKEGILIRETRMSKASHQRNV
jgi:hypothetical protein